MVKVIKHIFKSLVTDSEFEIKRLFAGFCDRDLRKLTQVSPRPTAKPSLTQLDLEMSPKVPGTGF